MLCPYGMGSVQKYTHYMMQEIIWLAPLLILPGVAGIVISTGARFNTLHDELHHWLTHAADGEVTVLLRLAKRARHFRNALLGLYGSAFVFILASVAGAIAQVIGVSPDIVVLSVVFVGVLCLAVALFELFQESLLAMDVIEAHIAAIQRAHAGQPAHLEETHTHD